LNQRSLIDKEGREIPYGPWRYKRIIEECYYISHTINTSYNDILKVSPRERQYMLEFLQEELQKQKESRDKLNNMLENKK